MKNIRILLFTATLVAAASLVQAHSLWINSFESYTHDPAHAMVSLGWGHAIPMDDILNSVNGRIAIREFQIIDPALKKVDLIKPDFEVTDPEVTETNFDVYAADLAAQKVALKSESAQGVYQLSAVSVPTFYTQYIDTDGKTRMKLKPKNELDNIETVIMSVKYQAFAKAFLTVGEWENPAPLGHGLEIIPKTDLTDLHVGDLVEVEVLFCGEPLTASAKSMDYITAGSAGFGQSDSFGLYAYIMSGKARFRVQSSGQWVVNVYHKEEVTKDGELKDLYGKAEQVYHSASLTFNVK